MINKEIKVPDVGAETFEVTEIISNIGDKINFEDPVITIEGDKTSIEIPSTTSGIVKKIFVQVGDKVTTNSLIMLIEKDQSKNLFNDNIDKINNNKDNSVNKKNFNSNDIDANVQNDIHATPIVRRLSKKFNVNINNIKGSGRNHLILKEDIYSYIRNAISYYNNNDKNYLKDQQKNKNITNNKTEEIFLNKIQQTTSDHLYKSWINIPHVTMYEKIDITDLEKFRKLTNLELNKKITLLIFLLKIISIALKKFPIFNSSLSVDKNKVILKKFINIGVAVDTNAGLIVPVINNIDKKNIINLSKELSSLIKKCREKKLSLKNIQNSCFTISNLGGLGSTFFSPIINAPEVAILGISKSTIEPIWNGNKFVPRLLLPLSLSFDHRVINGADSVRFINYIMYLVKDIRNLLL